MLLLHTRQIPKRAKIHPKKRNILAGQISRRLNQCAISSQNKHTFCILRHKLWIGIAKNWPLIIFFKAMSVIQRCLLIAVL